MIFRKNKKQYTDQELLSQYRETKEQQILAELYTRYTHMVYGVCLKYLKNPDDASDAVMNIYERLSKDIHRHQIIKFSTWLYVITKNHCLMELRARKTQEKQYESWQENYLTFMESDDFLHPIDDNSRLNEKQLELCIEQLKTDQRNCIDLFYFQNKCYLEIAQTLQIDEKQVKSHLQNGKRNLKICLENIHEAKEAS